MSLRPAGFGVDASPRPIADNVSKNFIHMTTALLVDDHPIVLQGCRTVLRDIGIEHMIEATSVVAGYRAFLRHAPDVVVLDLTFEGDDLGGLSLISRIANSDKKARILVFSMHNDAAIVSRALESGALSYVLKDTASTELATAFEKVLLGEPHLSHKLAIQVAMLRSKGGSPRPRILRAGRFRSLPCLDGGTATTRSPPSWGSATRP